MEWLLLSDQIHNGGVESIFFSYLYHHHFLTETGVEPTAVPQTQLCSRITPRAFVCSAFGRAGCAPTWPEGPSMEVPLGHGFQPRIGCVARINRGWKPLLRQTRISRLRKPKFGLFSTLLILNTFLSEEIPFYRGSISISHEFST